MALQKQVNIGLSSGVEGDFASTNPRHTLLAGKAQHRVGSTPVLVGGFAEIDASTGLTVSTLTGKNPIGFVGLRDNIGVIVTWLADSTLQVQPGQGLTLFDKGDFYVRLAGANYGDAVTCDATGKIVSGGAIATPFKVAVPTDSSGLAVITGA